MQQPPPAANNIPVVQPPAGPPAPQHSAKILTPPYFFGDVTSGEDYDDWVTTFDNVGSCNQTDLGT